MANKVKGGFDEKWTTVVEEYMCPICLLVSREAVACACGALFCEDCRAMCTSCPNCRSESAVHPAFRDRRAIQNLVVGCPLGCAVVFRLGDHSSHVQHACTKRMVPCPACHMLVMLSDHPVHQNMACVYRQVNCEECNALVSLAELAKHQRQSCLGKHVECALCGEMVRMDRLEAHTETGGHISILLDRVVALEKRVQQQQTEILVLRTQLQDQRESARPRDSGILAQGRHTGKYMVCGAGGCSTHERFLSGHCDPLKRINGNKPVALWSCCGVLDGTVTSCATRPLAVLYPQFSWKSQPT